MQEKLPTKFAEKWLLKNTMAHSNRYLPTPHCLASRPARQSLKASQDSAFGIPRSKSLPYKSAAFKSPIADTEARPGKTKKRAHTLLYTRQIKCCLIKSPLQLSKNSVIINGTQL